jgi:hypothetical protein
MNFGETNKSNRIVKKTDVKLCTLCGTLNYRGNTDCFTCGWHGSFSQDQPIIELAWMRFESLYEEIRAEHITAKLRRPVGDFGADRPASLLERMSGKITGAWERFQIQRDLHMAQRAAGLKPRIPSKPDQLGV